MTIQINKDTTLCMSLAARPSNFGTRFHNYLYQALGLNFIYKAFSPTDLAAAIAGMRALNIRGCGVSMPFKEACLPLVDELDDSAKAIQSINTIVNTDGHLKAYNTDYIAIAKLLAEHQIPPDLVFALQGSGGMAKAVACTLRNAGSNNGHIVSRNEMTGRALSEKYGFTWHPCMEGVQADLLINATPIGMAGGAEANHLSFSKTAIDNARVIFDVVAFPADTPLVRYAQGQGKKVITGDKVFSIQAMEQFVLYTGIQPSTALFMAAAKFARG